MKSKILLSTLLFALLSSNAFAADKTTSGDKAVAQDDKDIMAVLIVLNKNEINAANEALKQSKNTDVDDYAHMMKKHHTENLNETMKLKDELHAHVKDNSDAKDLKDAGKKEGKELASLKGVDFDKAYIGDMVKDHEDALKLIDDKLLPKVSNEKLKSLLEATQKTVQSHLDKAKEIQDKLKG
jgi:putative membrane protein